MRAPGIAPLGAGCLAVVAACFPNAPPETNPAPGAPASAVAGEARTIPAQALKADAIRSVPPAVSYGDSDGGIADTHEADPAIRAIRIIRSPVSYNERPFQPGKSGEEILANSAA